MSRVVERSKSPEFAAAPPYSAFLCALLALQAHAAAPAQDCIGPSYEGQRLRSEGKYREARGLFTKCAAESCPNVIRASCTEWHTEVDRLIPSISVVVRDGEGIDVLDAQVTIDEERVNMRRGELLELDPGEHSVAVRTSRGSLDTKLVLGAGEKGRPVTLKLAPVPVSNGQPSTTTAAAGSSRPSPALPVALTIGAGVGGILFGILGVVGNSNRDALASEPCAKTLTCPPERTQGVRNFYIAADVFLALGAVAAAAALVTWIRWGLM